MAVNTKMPLTNTADGYLCEGTDIKGGYFVIDTIANIPSTITETGSLCYCQGESKFYRYNGTAWVEETFVTEADKNSWNAKLDASALSDWAKAATKPVYNQGEIADTNDYVRMTPAERNKLSRIEAEANKYVHPDKHSVNEITGLATVATSGSYTDLINIPEKFTPSEHTHPEYLTELPEHTHDYIPTTEKGAASGVAELDDNGLILTSQLPSYVDDVLEYDTIESFPGSDSAEKNKIYVDTSTNKTYRWGGESYVEISASLALGNTEFTAHRGDHGSAAYTHSLTTGNPHGVTKGDIGLSKVENKSSEMIRSELTDTNIINALGYTPLNAETPIEEGTGANSLRQQATAENIAQSLNSAAFGENNKVGIKGYFFNNIDFENKIIKISGTQPGALNKTEGEATSEVGVGANEDFDSGWQQYDVISIVNGSKYDAALVITNIFHDMIHVATLTDSYTFIGYSRSDRQNPAKGGKCYDIDAALPFTEVKNVVPDYDDYGVSNIDRPDCGVADLSYYAFAEGVEGVSYGAASHVEGKQNKALGHYSHAEGRKTFATYIGHAEGYMTFAKGQGAHAEGHKSQATSGDAHAEGFNTRATAKSAHAEGNATAASGTAAHAEGSGSKAISRASHAEGISAEACNEAAHAEGYSTKASGLYSHAGGHYSIADGTYSFAHGNNVIADYDHQTVFGKYNAKNSTALAQWGNGNSEEARSNAFEILFDGSFNYNDPVLGYVNSSVAKQRTADTISQNYSEYTSSLERYIKDNCSRRLRSMKLGNEQFYSYNKNDVFMCRNYEQDSYYSAPDSRSSIYNISSNLILEENHGYNYAKGLKFSFLSDGNITVNGTIDADITPENKYAQFQLLQTNAAYTEEVKFICQNANTIYLGLSSAIYNMDTEEGVLFESDLKTRLVLHYKETHDGESKYLQVKVGEEKELDRTQIPNIEIINLYLQLDLTGMVKGDSIWERVFPYISVKGVTYDKGQIIEIPNSSTGLYALLKNGMLFSHSLDYIDIYTKKNLFAADNFEGEELVIDGGNAPDEK